jgi:opacity protein-like surface antigen
LTQNQAGFSFIVIIGAFNFIPFQEGNVRNIFILSCLFILIVFSAAGAQDLQGMFNVSPFGGLAMPMGDLADDDPVQVMEGDAAFRSMGFKFGVAVEYFFTPNLGAGIDFRYATFGSKDVEFEEGTFESDSKVTGMMFGAHGKYMFMTEGTVRPYGILGAGMFIGKFKDVEGFLYGMEGTLDIDMDSKFYILFGGGLSYFVSPTISIFGEATFDYAMTDGAKLKIDDEEIAEIGTNYYFIDLIVGINVWFGGTE